MFQKFAIAEREERADDRPVVYPWWTARFGIVSWWDMEQFSARAFYQIGKLLEKVCTEHEMYRSPGDAMFTGSGANHTLSPDRVRGLQNFMQRLIEHCSVLGLEMSIQQIQFITDNAAVLTNGRAAIELQQLDKMIRWEMENHLFFFVSPDLAKYYDKPDLLGPAVIAKWHNLEYDIVEAGNCYAMGRSTAVVFHLMRVMEFGVQELGVKLGVALANEKNWQNILDEVNKGLKSLPPKDPTTMELSQAAANLYAVKLKWRNPTMHPTSKYTLEEAKSLITQAGIFMEQLAKIL